MGYGGGTTAGRRLEDMATIARTPTRLTWPALTWSQITTGALALGYLALRLVHVAGASIALYPDSADYRGVAALPLPRPPAYPLVIRLLGGNLAAVVALQWLVATVAWLVLALVMARGLARPWLRPVAVALILALGASTPVAQWDTAILTESLALSAGALLLAAALMLAHQWRGWLVGAVVVLAALWLGLRDTNAYTLGLLAGCLLVAALRHRAPARVVVLLLCLLVLSAGSMWSARVTGRGVFPFDDVILMRVLPDHDRAAAYAAAGLPLTPALLAESGHDAAHDDFATATDPALAGYRAWRDMRGQSVYLRDLLTHPTATLLAPLADAPRLLTLDIPAQRPPGFRAALGGWLDRVLWPVTLVALILALPLLWRGPRWPWLLVLTTLPVLVLIWHADAQEITRHALLTNVQWHLGGLLAGLMALDQWRTNCRHAGSSAP